MTETTAPIASAPADDSLFHALCVADVRREANDATSLIFDIPDALTTRFAYRAGQYLTVRAEIGGAHLYRCYSMSTAPETDAHLRITVKRVADGRVSQWINSAVKAGDTLHVMAPAGRFVLRDRATPLVLLGGGSGITPLLSLAKSALATTARPVALVYANRDRASIIFAAELDDLAKAYPARFRLTHWLDTERGLIDVAALRGLGVLDAGSDHYICGPGPFMEIAEAAALDLGADRAHVFVERFVSPPDEQAIKEGAAEAAPELAGAEPCETVTITLRGQTRELPYQAGDTVLITAQKAGFRPAYSCQAGQCANCMAKLTAGTVTMKQNFVLLPDEVAQGYVLTCQSIPTAKHVSIDYEY